jgi:hypothetical protein
MLALIHGVSCLAMREGVFGYARCVNVDFPWPGKTVMTLQRSSPVVFHHYRVGYSVAELPRTLGKKMLSTRSLLMVDAMKLLTSKVQLTLVSRGLIFYLQSQVPCYSTALLMPHLEQAAQDAPSALRRRCPSYQKLNSHRVTPAQPDHGGQAFARGPSTSLGTPSL